MSDPNSPEPDRPRFRHPLEQPPREDNEEQEREEAVRKGKMVRVRFEGNFTRPYLTYGLLIINVAIFLVRYIDPALADRMLLGGMIDPYSILHLGQWYRLVTGMFLHGSEAHILMNGISLYSLGTTVEASFGYRRYLVLYFLGGLLGSALHLLLGGNIPAVGASGAIFALVGAEILFLRRHNRYYGELVRRQTQSLVILAGLNLAAGWFAEGIAFWGHMGGFIGGMALTWFIGPQYIVPPNAPVDENRTVIAVDTQPMQRAYREIAAYCVGLLVLLVLAAVFVHPQPFEFVP